MLMAAHGDSSSRQEMGDGDLLCFDGGRSCSRMSSDGFCSVELMDSIN
jgi:hypothetical protein